MESGRWKSLFAGVSVFDTSLSFAEKLIRVLFYLFVGASSTITAVLARMDPLIKQLGPVYWVGIGILTALAISLAFFLTRLAFSRNSLGAYYNRLAVPKSNVNPLEEGFKDIVINVEDLRLPLNKAHEGKHFKRCIFSGPGVMGIVGGAITHNQFTSCGHGLAVPPGAAIAGVVVLKGCTVEECEFIGITIVADYTTGYSFMENGLTFHGLPEKAMPA